MAAERGVVAELAGLSPQRLVDHLRANSGLPGPRANLTLLAAFVEVAPGPLAVELSGSAEEYLACCGTAALGRLLAELWSAAGADGPDDVVALLRDRAADGRWRVREGAAMAVQRLGDASPEAMRTLVAAWVRDEDPLVRRAAVAGICEPRLLREAGSAALALEACATATASITAVHAAGRREAGLRTLRQALGYCWSVAVAAAPEPGLVAFCALDEADPDVAWIVRENRKKARLRRLLDGR